MPSSPIQQSRSPSPADGSQAGDANGQGTKAAKDRECPFCHHPFTSSSLGRHLDLYIKSKNPKPPDGIHDVVKIRELRGKITRRQPRGSLKKQDQGDETGEEGGTHSPVNPGIGAHPAPSNERELPAQGRGVHIVPKVPLHIDRDAETQSPTMRAPSQNHTGPSEQMRKTFGAGFSSTGVIPGLGNASADMDRFSGPPRYKYLETRHLPPDLRHDTDRLFGDEVGRAAQLALREVLDSLEAARTHAVPPQLFDFDFYGQTFPSLCLRILPSPRTLFSLHPYSTAESWPLSNPGEVQMSALREAITARAFQLSATSPQETLSRALRHLDTSYAHFSNLSEGAKREQYHLELLRALAQSQKKFNERNAELKLARQQAEYFRAQYERVLNRSSAYSNPATPDLYSTGATGPLPITAEMLTEVERNDTESRTWNYDRLIAKWRSKVNDTHRNGGGGRGASSTPATSVRARSPPAPTPSQSIAMTGSLPRPKEPARILWDDDAWPRGLQRKEDEARRRAEETAPTPGSVGGTPLNHLPGLPPRTGGDSRPDRGDEWMDQASRAVEKVMSKGDRWGREEGDVGGGGGAEGRVNGNGKRERPASWWNGERATAGGS